MLDTERTVRINLFGRAVLTSDGAPLRFNAPPRVLSLLGYLLLHAGAPLTRDSIAFTLWPDDDESDARANLRRHLFKLINDVLPPTPSSSPFIVADKRTVAWNDSAAASSDVRDFTRLAADPAKAAEAASLYTGDFLEGLEDEWLLAPREQFRERQIRLLLGLIDENRTRRDFAAGIASARQLLTIDPWREDGVRALIALRHLSGDRAGALSTYRDFAKRLKAEMGVEPMLETTAEYERIVSSLDGRAVTAAAAEPAGNLSWHAPESAGNAEALRTTASFTGREPELAAIDAALWHGPGRCAIGGLGGIGKSAVAREYARRHRDRYAAVWWLNADTESGIIDGLVALGSTFVPAVATLENRRGAAEHVVSNVLTGLKKPVLLVYDNLEDESLLNRWCPPEECHALVTSRNCVWGGDIVAVPLHPWHVEDTVGYLRRETGRADIGDADAALVADALGGLPLAVAHAAAYLKRTANVSPRRYLERLNDHLARAPKGADYAQAVFATFEQAIGRAEEDAPGAAAVLCLAAFYAPDALPEELFRQEPHAYDPLVPALPANGARIDLRAAVSDESSLEEALGALDRFSLLELSSVARTYSMHRLVASAARRSLGTDEASWARTAVAVAEAAYPETRFEAWPDCERLLPHARAALDLLDSDVCFPEAARLATRCARYLRERAAFGEAEILMRRGLATAEACDRIESFPGIADNISALGSLLRDTNRLAEAEPLLRRALEKREAAAPTDDSSVAGALSDLAILLTYYNRLTEAEAHFRRALAIDETHGIADPPVVARRLGNLAIVLHEKNGLEEAEALFRRALAMEEAWHGATHPDVANALINLAWLLMQTSRKGEAEPMFLRAAAIYSAAYGESHPSYAHAASDLAVLLHAGNRSQEAEEYERHALVVFEAAYGADHPVVAACLNNLAEVVGDHGGFAEAEALYRRALTSDEANFGLDHTTVARDLNNLAGLLFRTGRTSEADALLGRALEILDASYPATHPRIRIVRDNEATLHEHEHEHEPERAPGAPRWRVMRRSPSRSLR